MTWIPTPEMKSVYQVRQEFAKAKGRFELEPTAEHEEAFNETSSRRDRAIRMLHRDDGISVPHLAGMFRCSKTTIRAALEREEE